MKENNISSFQKAVCILPPYVRAKVLSATASVYEDIQDVVLRNQRPVCIYTAEKQLYLTESGCLTDNLTSQQLVYTTSQQMLDCFNNACGYSVYSHINEIKDGFITISGGHRVGISGTAVMSGDSIHNIRDVSTISLRISRQIKGCADDLTREYVRSKKGLLICGSPSSGKTTLLRDMARLLSTQYSSRVSLIDTRGEVASVYQGVCQNDVGLCDVLDSYPRTEGIVQAIRSLSPEHIICDEIGSQRDAQAIMQGINSGVRFIATVHAHNRQELLSRNNIKDILATGAFEKVVFLTGRDKPCIVRKTYTQGELSCV